MSHAQSPDDAPDAKIIPTLFSARPHEDRRTRAGSIVLEVIVGADRGRAVRVDVQSHPRITCGRGHGHHFVLEDSSISANHFALELRDDRIMLQDLNSTNGLWLGKVGIDRAWLTDGSEFEAGDCKIRLRVGEVVEVGVSKAEHYAGIVGRSAVMRELFVKIDRISKQPHSVLISGETGTGKELVAAALHSESGRTGRYVVVDCTSLPRDLAESILFGHSRGAFTGAVTDHPGLVEQADGGTLFLDEIGDLPPEQQGKLLRVLETKQVQRLGDAQGRRADVRFVAATHRDLYAMVASSTFRGDLLQRLTTFELLVPPLRQRREDIAVLARHFLSSACETAQRDLVLSEDAIAVLEGQRWEGNGRQLRNVIDRAVCFAEGSVITGRDVAAWLPKSSLVPPPLASSPSDALYELPLKEATTQNTNEFQRRYCERLLLRAGGDFRKATDLSGYSDRGLKELLVRLGLHKDDERR